MAEAPSAAKLQPELTRAQVAKMFGVSPRMLAYAGKVQRYGTPELNRAVEDGSLVVSVAAKLADLSWEEQQKALRGGKTAIRAVVSNRPVGQWNIDQALKQLRKAMGRIEDRWPEECLGLLAQILKQMGEDILAHSQPRSEIDE